VSKERDTLLAAWLRWDAAPGSYTPASAMVDACRAYAPGQTLHLRRFLAAARRHGASYERALDLWETEW
jgi:hypothetical protein